MSHKNQDDCDRREYIRRRTALATTAGLLSGSLSGCLSALGGGSGNRKDDPRAAGFSLPASAWPQLGYDARNTRHAPDARGPRDDTTVAWTSLGDRSVHPPVVDDALYLASSAWTDGTALSLGLEDGDERWSNSELAQVRWAPALHENRLLVLTFERDSGVRLHALDTATGEQTWVQEEGLTASTGKSPPNSPTVRDGTIYVGSDRGVVACDAATGDIDWTTALDATAGEEGGKSPTRTSWATPSVTADLAVTFDRNDTHGQTRAVYAVDSASGDEEWTADLDVGDGWSLEGHPVVGADYVFVAAVQSDAEALSDDDSEWSGAARLFAIEADSGTVAWDVDWPHKTLHPPAFADGTVYVAEWQPGADSETARVHALDESGGSVTWTYETGTSGVPSPTVAGDTVYVNQGEELAAVARADGKRRWRLDVGDRTGPPVVVGATAYLRTKPWRNEPSRVVAVREL